ncbi:MAG TPA: hypothetical protein VKB76_19795, partial [Ktedonobacterales bacterium]|nr:hypothetical protein [Ktedonobacterales bacterium]
EFRVDAIVAPSPLVPAVSCSFIICYINNNVGTFSPDNRAGDLEKSASSPTTKDVSHDIAH